MVYNVISTPNVILLEDESEEEEWTAKSTLNIKVFTNLE
jgi:hypothetical protein